MRRIFVGDIQGCSQALDRLLQTLHPGPQDRLICLGDVVNRGPDSLGVLRRLADFNATVVLGNHDLYLLRLAQGPHQQRLSEPLLEPILAAPDGAALLAWMAKQPIVLVEPDIVAVHAGLHPDWDDIEVLSCELNRAVLDHQGRVADARIKFATLVRYCDARGNRPWQDDPAPGPPFQPWDTFYQGHRTVVFGHWARRGLVCELRRRGLDTGCVYGGSLTAWIAEEDRFVQVAGQASAP